MEPDKSAKSVNPQITKVPTDPNDSPPVVQPNQLSSEPVVPDQTSFQADRPMPELPSLDEFDSSTDNSITSQADDQAAQQAAAPIIQQQAATPPPQPLSTDQSQAYGASTFAATPPSSSQRSRKKIVVTILLIVLAILVIGGAAAAAYVGYYVPNQPKNVLKQATLNTLQERKVTTDGQVNIAPVDPDAENSFPATKVNFEGSSNADTMTGSATINVVVSGVDFPLEARYLDKNLYIKVGDLTTLKAAVGSLVGIEDPAAQEQINQLLDSVSQAVSDQWILIDSTLLEQAGANCSIENFSKPTEGDLKLLEGQFVKNPFATVESNSDDTVGSLETIRYVVNIDEKKANNYANSLGQLTAIKELEKCGAEDQVKDNVKELTSDTGSFPMTVWVDKESKRIVKLAGTSTARDAGQENTKGSYELNLAYKADAVTAPENAKPVLQLFDELQNTLMTNPLLQDQLMAQ